MALCAKMLLMASFLVAAEALTAKTEQTEALTAVSGEYDWKAWVATKAEEAKQASMIGQVGAAPAPAVATPYVKSKTHFFNTVALLLTCKNLEGALAQLCGGGPLYKSIHQFAGKVSTCKAAMAKVPELGALFVNYFANPVGAPAQAGDCMSITDFWRYKGPRFGPFKSLEECSIAVRGAMFKEMCKII